MNTINITKLLIHIQNVKTHIVICRTYGGANKTIWLSDCGDFWAAVEKARYLPQPMISYPPKPVTRNGWEHLHAARVYEWKKEKTRVDIENGGRIKDVLEIKEWTLG